MARGRMPSERQEELSSRPMRGRGPGRTRVLILDGQPGGGVDA